MPRMDRFEREDRFDRACEALRAGEHVRALAMLDQLAALDEPDAAVFAVRAHALLLGGNDREALAEAQRAVELAPGSPAAQQVLAWAAWQGGHLGPAQRAFETLVELSEHAPGELASYAEFMACERGPRLGEEAARKALAADKSSATAWAALGIAQYRMHHYRDAESSLRRALALDPNNPRAQWGMVLLLKDRGEHTRADALASFLRQTPGAAAFADAVHDEAAKRLAVERLYERRTAEAPAVVRRGREGDRVLQWAVALVAILGLIGLAWWAGFSVLELGIVALVVGLAAARYLWLTR
jgi:Tfp pilus assembly protein PilF